MLAQLIVAVLNAAAPQTLHVSPTDCSELRPERFGYRDLGELTAGSGFITCPPEGPGRHVYRFNGFAGEQVAVWLGGYSVSGTTDLNLELSVTGPDGYSAGGAVKRASILLSLPHTGEYRLEVENRAPPGISTSAYTINFTEHEAMPPQRFDDCSRFALPGSKPGIEVSSYFLRPGGSATLRPTWTMKGRTYDARPECFAGWTVSSPLARLARNTVGNWTIILDPAISEGTVVGITATAGGQEAVNTFTVDSTERRE